MVRWIDVLSAEPAFGERVRDAFEAGRHKTMATVRRDGSPRISGIEVEFVDGDIWIGTMAGSVKARDLRRDGRLAVHSPSIDPPADDPTAWPGEAKVAGRAIGSGEGSSGTPGSFRIDLDEVVLTRIGEPADHLVIEAWHPERGLERIERR